MRTNRTTRKRQRTVSPYGSTSHPETVGRCDCRRTAPCCTYRHALGSSRVATTTAALSSLSCEGSQPIRSDPMMNGSHDCCRLSLLPCVLFCAMNDVAVASVVVASVLVVPAVAHLHRRLRRSCFVMPVASSCTSQMTN